MCYLSVPLILKMWS